MPTQVNKSVTRHAFTLVSSGLSTPIDGDRFTSNNHGLSVLSIRMSKPYSSKQLFTLGTNILHAEIIVWAQARTALIIKSSIFNISK